MIHPVWQSELDALIAGDPALKRLSDVAGALPDRRLEPSFAGLAWVVIGQQISAAAGRAIYARCESRLGAITADEIIRADDATLKGAGLSAPKIRTLRALASAVADDGLDPAGLAKSDTEEVVAALSAIKGIGRWTAEVYALFALGHRDAFPAGDLALREAARIGFDLAERPREKALLARAECWRPRRSLAARLLWAYYRAVKLSGGGTPV